MVPARGKVDGAVLVRHTMISREPTTNNHVIPEPVPLSALRPFLSSQAEDRRSHVKQTVRLSYAPARADPVGVVRLQSICAERQSQALSGYSRC
jgi:hypothetical protein